MTAQVESNTGIRYTISANANETNASILSRASSFYGIEAVTVLKRPWLDEAEFKALKAFTYKRFRCVPTRFGIWNVFTPEEMEQPAGFRDVEMECGSVKECKDFIDSY